MGGGRQQPSGLPYIPCFSAEGPSALPAVPCEEHRDLSLPCLVLRCACLLAASPSACPDDGHAWFRPTSSAAEGAAYIALRPAAADVSPPVRVEHAGRPTWTNFL